MVKKKRNMVILAAVLATLLISAVIFALLRSAGQTAIRKKCMAAVEKLMERESVRLTVTSQSEGEVTTATLYYDRKDGKPRWYEVLNNQVGKHESFVMNGVKYGRYDPEDFAGGIKTTWGRNTLPSLFEQIPEYREKKERELLYPTVLSNLFDWSDEKEMYETVRRLEDGRYEFQYSALALDRRRQERIEEAKQNYEWYTEIAAQEVGLENSELYLQSSAAAVRWAEEMQEMSYTTRIGLDESGNVKTLEYASSSKSRMVMPDLETGELNVSEEFDFVEGSSLLEIEAVDDPSIKEFLDEMAVAVEQEYQDTAENGGTGGKQ